MKIYEEIANFIAKSAGAEKLTAFRPSKAVARRVEALTQKHKTGVITKAERDELDHYVMMEHVMSMAKARSHRLAVSA